MKLLYVIHQYFPDCFSGTEQYCLATSREARRRGDEVVVLSLWPDYARDNPPLLLEDQPYDGFVVLRLRQWARLQPNAELRDYENPLPAAMFRQVLRDEQPDAVHFFHLRNLGSDLLDVAAEEGVRTVVNLMDFWYLCPRFTLLKSDGVTLCEGPPDGGLGCIPCHAPDLEGAWTAADTAPAALAFAHALPAAPAGPGRDARFAALMQRKDVLLGRLARADAVMAPSRFLADMFAKNGFGRERMTVVPYGLEPGLVERIEVTRPRSPLRLGFLGVLSPWKAPHLAVEAVLQTEGALQLTVHGRIREGMFQDYIDATMERAKGDPRIRFPGPFDRAGLSQVLANLDVIVVPSMWYENTPFVILEALEAGVPVIASDLGGMAEVIVDGENGFLFESGNAAALAAVLRTCLDEPARLAALRPKPAGSIAGNYEVFRAAYCG